MVLLGPTPLLHPKAPIVNHDVRRELYLTWIPSVPLHVCRRPPPAAEPSLLDVKVLWYIRCGSRGTEMVRYTSEVIFTHFAERAGLR
jgi:hypothetical protein